VLKTEPLKCCLESLKKKEKKEKEKRLTLFRKGLKDTTKTKDCFYEKQTKEGHNKKDQGNKERRVR